MRNNSNYRTSMRYGDRDIGGDALQRELDENARIAQEAQDPNSERNKRLQEERELANDNYTYHQDILKNIQSI
ncbi:MAG: hypothetical protein H6767_09065 [Candidatus Peribacteria bacterium]|nr:MAG: hypothetical protein H6767_09065 [Candidatus Peribacteria bacterium]